MRFVQRAGYSIYFTSLDDMVRNLKAVEAAGRLTNKLGTYLRPGVLAVDEVGYPSYRLKNRLKAIERDNDVA